MQQTTMPVVIPIVQGVPMPQQVTPVPIVQSLPVQTTSEYDQQQVQRQQMNRVGKRIDGLAGTKEFYATFVFPTSGDTNSMAAGYSCCCPCPPPCLVMCCGEMKLVRNEAMRLKYHNGVITMPDAWDQRLEPDWGKVAEGNKIGGFCCGFEGCCFDCTDESGGGKWDLYDDGTIRNRKSPEFAIGSNANGTFPILVHATSTQERLLFKDVLQLAGTGNAANLEHSAVLT